MYSFKQKCCKVPQYGEQATLKHLKHMNRRSICFGWLTCDFTFRMPFNFPVASFWNITRGYLLRPYPCKRPTGRAWAWGQLEPSPLEMVSGTSCLNVEDGQNTGEALERWENIWSMTESRRGAGRHWRPYFKRVYNFRRRVQNEKGPVRLVVFII